MKVYLIKHYGTWGIKLDKPEEYEHETLNIEEIKEVDIENKTIEDIDKITDNGEIVWKSDANSLTREKINILNTLYSNIQDSLKNHKLTFRKMKYDKAKEWQQQNFIPARAPRVIVEEAKIKGIEPQELAKTIIQKYEEHERYVEELEILRQRFKTRIKKATTREELEQIDNEITNMFSKQ